MSYNTLVLGAGSWGTALSIVLSEQNKSSIWNVDSKVLNDIKNKKQNAKYLPGIAVANVHVEYELKTAIPNKDLIILAIPSKFCKSVIQEIAPLISQNQIIVSATKGIQASPLQTITEIIDLLVPKKRGVAVISGPSHAEETANKQYTCLVAASHDQDIASIVQKSFSSSWTRIYTNNDPRGVQVAAAIKNIIAIAAGIVSARNLGDNTLAALITRGLAEMTRFGVAVGSNLSTFYGLTGIGDLMVTGYSQHSRNRYVGEQLVLGKSIEEIEKSMVQIPEGIYAIKEIYSYAQEQNISMPITEAVYKILYENLPLKDCEKMLINRPLTNEN